MVSSRVYFAPHPHAPGADFRVCHRHKALPDLDDIRPLKALLDYTALVHEEHPLREPGVNGIKLYLGEWRTSRTCARLDVL